TNSVFLIIDVINDIVHPKGKLTCFTETEEYTSYMKNINLAIRKSTNENTKIILSNVRFSKDYSELPYNSPIFSWVKSVNALVKNTWGSENVELLESSNVEKVFEKNAINPFSNEKLVRYIHDNNITHLYIAGVSTRWAVESCVRSAHDLNLKVTILSDCCADASEIEHNNALSNCGVLGNVINVNEYVGK
ncbi:cysteine hydrolase, partial [Vibrio mediterranei]